MSKTSPIVEGLLLCGHCKINKSWVFVIDNAQPGDIRKAVKRQHEQVIFFEYPQPPHQLKSRYRVNNGHWVTYPT